MSLAKVAAQLRASLAQATHARVVAAGATLAATQSRNRLAALARGGAHPLLIRAIATLTEAIERLREADELAVGAAVAVSEYARTIGVDLGVPPSPVPRPTIEPATPVTPSVPQRVRRLAERLPQRSDRDPTHGLVYDASGRWRHDPFTSGRDNGAGAGLAFPLRASWSVTDHVEGHVAARMRAERVPEATLVINQAPCDDEPWGCDRILPAILPPGYTLTVYVADGDGVRWHATYRGTGKGITS